MTVGGDAICRKLRMQPTHFRWHPDRSAMEQEEPLKLRMEPLSEKTMGLFMDERLMVVVSFTDQAVAGGFIDEFAGRIAPSDIGRHVDDRHNSNS